MITLTLTLTLKSCPMHSTNLLTLNLLKLLLANVLRYVRYMLSAVRLLSVVCDVGAPYSGG